MSRTRDTANMSSPSGTFTGNIDSTGIVTARTGVQLGDNSATSVIALEAATATTSSTSQVNIDTFSSSVYRSAQYQIQITRGALYHLTTLNVLHDGSSVFLSEFGTIKTTSTSLASFDADINSGSVRVRATPSSSSSTTFKVSKVLTKV